MTRAYQDYMKFQLELGKELKLARLEKGLQCSEVARLAGGMSTTFIKKAERGSIRMFFTVIRLIVFYNKRAVIYLRDRRPGDDVPLIVKGKPGSAASEPVGESACYDFEEADREEESYELAEEECKATACDPAVSGQKSSASAAVNRALSKTENPESCRHD